jgi:hypothetical protein
VNAFIGSHRGEIVALYFSHFNSFNGSQYVRLAELIQADFGPARLCNENDVKTKTVLELSATGKNIVVFCDNEFYARQNYPWLLNHELFYSHLRSKRPQLAICRS